MQYTELDRTKTKLIVFFSVLGLAGFFLNLLAGIGVWSHGQTKAVAIPTYDQYANVMRTISSNDLPKYSRDLFESWSECATSLDGMNSVVVHALITGSVAGIVFFGVCAVLGWQLYRKINNSLSASNSSQ
ncbi:MAG: hypothetical protein VW684_12675 [Betaproteobacteria bacterium]|jgi:hypothetical protein